MTPAIQENCWSEPPAALFSVRGHHYLKDRKKIPSEPSLYFPLGLDLLYNADLTAAGANSAGSPLGTNGNASGSNSTAASSTGGGIAAGLERRIIDHPNSCLRKHLESPAAKLSGEKSFVLVLNFVLPGALLFFISHVHQQPLLTMFAHSFNKRPRPRIELPLASVPAASESGGHGQDILGDEANPLTGDARTDPLLARLAAGDEVSHGAIHPRATIST